MSSPVGVISLAFRGYDLQRADLNVMFAITEGLDTLPEFRGQDQLIPFRTGRLPVPRTADRRPVVATGWVAGAAPAPETSYRAYLDGLKAVLDPTLAEAYLVATLPDGSVRWIKAKASNLIGGELIGHELRPMSIEWEALDPFWYSAYGIGTLDDDDSYRAYAAYLGPVGYWRVGEASGTAMAAVVGPAGTYVNAPTLGVPGALAGDTDTAVTFNGTSQYGKVAGTILSAATDLSMAFWLNIAAQPGNFRRVFHALGSGQTVHGFFNGDGTSGLYGRLGGSGDYWLSGTSVNLTGGWKFLVLTLNAAGQAKWSLNGAPLAATGGQATGHTTTTITDLGLGASFTGGNYLAGTLDEPKIFPRLLSDAEIAALYTLGLYGPAPAPDGFLDDGGVLDDGGEVVVTPSSTIHALALDTVGSAAVEKVILRFVGPSLTPPGIEVDTPEGIVGFVMAAALAAGQELVVDTAAGTALIGGISQRGSMTLQAANAHGEYVHLLARNNSIRLLGAAARVGLTFNSTWL